MSAFYTSVERVKSRLYIRGYNEDKKRVTSTVPCKPYLFLPDPTNTSKIKTLEGTPVKRLEFDSTSDAYAFTTKYRDIKNFSIFGSEKHEYVYIYDNYKDMDFDIDLIKTVYLDIEVAGKPEVDEAVNEVTAITLRFNKDRYTFSTVDFSVDKLEKIADKENIHYFKMRDEVTMLHSFLNIWTTIDPDIVTGWYIKFFDLPYLINRIRRIMSNEDANRFSPHRILHTEELEIKGKTHKVFYPLGVSVLDYLDLYKKFTYSQREEYSLNFICYFELGEKKIDYAEQGSLDDLFEKDPQKFIEYNIYDVDLVYLLEEKLKFIELVITMSYDAKINFEDALGSVVLWDTIIHNYLRDRNIVVPFKHHDKEWRQIVGAYVKEPQVGMHEWVLSFDLTSLYPHLIIAYNISPETFLKKAPISSIEDIIKNKNMGAPSYPGAIAANGCVYSKDVLGFLPALMKRQFALRNQYKDKMLDLKKEKAKGVQGLDKQITKYHNFQLAKKIQLNSAYGCLSNQWFRFSSIDQAESITYSGQLVIRWVEKTVNDFLNKLLKTDEDYIIASDTDSIYVKVKTIVEMSKLTDEQKIADFLDSFANNVIQPKLNKCFEELAKITNAYENALHMKRESIITTAIWRAKKNYALNVLDNEGVRYKAPELKTMGIETVRSSTPEACRDALKKCIEIIMTGNLENTRKFVADFKKHFFTLPFEQIAFPRSVSDINSYADSKTIYAHGTPMHTRGCLLYNHYLKRHGLQNQHPLISNRDKIKFIYLKLPNPIFENTIAAPKFLPKEFGLDKYIDYETQFQKTFLDPILSILNVIPWELEERQTLESFFA